MKVVLIICLILVYLLIGYVLTAVMIALDFSDWANDPDIMLFAGSLMWPFLNIPIIVISIIAKIIIWLGNKIATYPVSIALIIKTIIERKRKVGKIGKDTTASELSSIRNELLERKDELVSFGQLIERFDDVDAEYGGSPWTLEQIYANFNVLMGIESVESPSHNRVKTELEPCADMVSRDAMWEVLQRLYGTEGELVEELMSLPPVLPMPKIGKWIYRKEEDSYRCSLCNFPCHKDNMGAIPTTYCAECGAKMEV